MKRVLTVFGILAACVLAIVAGAFGYFFLVTRGVSLDPSKLALDANCIAVYDADGEKIGTEKAHRAVSFSEFPSHLPNAFVAVEDKRFYRHSGFDYRRMVKAALKNVSTLSFREGASTISQQLIKNTHLTNEKTVRRKLKELKLTYALEKNYTKEEILERYLNSIYFGHSAFGIGDAAFYYFGKEVSALEPAESALLAALVKSPNRYSPFKNPQDCLLRRNFVLELMKEQGYLGEADCTLALRSPLPAQPHPLGSGNSYLSLVYEELEELFPEAKAGELGNLRVYTAYEPRLQAKLEAFGPDSDAAMLVADNKTNTLKALRATAGLPRRLPASTVKPLLVYAPAIEENLLSPATPISDERTDFGGYSPDDAGGASGTYVSARYALSKSVNIPAVRVLNALGVEKGASYLKKMGLEVGREDYSLALALGGMKEGFTLKELADGYTALANGGAFAPSRTIVRVEDASGRTIYRGEPQRTRVFSEDTSFLVTDMLKTAAEEGTARKLRSLPFQVAAKTGTHEAKAGNLDAYTIAYTAEDTVAVWLGNADNSPIDATGGGLPANYAKEILASLYETRSPADFTMPKDVVRAAYDKTEYEENHKLVRADPLAPALIDPEDFFRASNLPAEQSTRFSRPTIQKPQIKVENGSVTIVLCHAEYYDYVIKRRHCGEETTVYRGPYREAICDNSVVVGEEYEYTVLPVYQKNEGEAVVLPRVRIGSVTPIPEDWWRD